MKNPVFIENVVIFYILDVGEMETPSVEDRQHFVECLKILNTDAMWHPLPCRESEIGQISLFIEESFQNEGLQTMMVSGPPLCGKTSVLQFCISISPFEKQIFYTNCENQDLNFLDEVPNDMKKLIILDNFVFQNHNLMIPFCSEHNCSIIFVTRTGDEFLDASRKHIFSKYTRYQIEEILKEKLQNKSSCIPDEILHHISAKIDNNHLSIPDSVQMLIEYLNGAIMQLDHQTE